VAQLTSSFNPLSTADPRARGSVRRASGFVHIAISLKMPPNRGDGANRQRKLALTPAYDNDRASIVCSAR
jgi:hypothetical protein